MNRNIECDSIKTSEIGQSAAKPLSLKKDKRKVQRLSRKGVGSKRSRSARQTKKWSKYHDCCIVCDSTRFRATTREGICSRCYDKKRKRSFKKGSIGYDKALIRAKKWKYENRERVCAKAKKYYWENREYVLSQKNEINHGGNYMKTLERDNFTCQRCGGDNASQLIVHHMQKNNHALNFQVTLCISCHISIHKRKNRLSSDHKFFV